LPTLRHGKAKYRKAEQEYVCGFIGLIPQRKGNPTTRYSEEDLTFIDKIIEEEYETYKWQQRNPVRFSRVGRQTTLNTTKWSVRNKGR
jgi:hypothetical protein